YGGTDLFDPRLIVSGEDGDAGKEIAFFVDGIRAPETAVYAAGTSTTLDLAVTKEETSDDDSPGSSGSSGSSGSTGSSGSSSRSSGSSASSPQSVAPAEPVMEYTGRGTLDTDAGGAVRHATIITTAEEGASLSIGQGVVAQDQFGRPLDSVTIQSAPLRDLPAAGPGAEPVGRAVRCGPAGATFDPPITVSFTLTPEEWDRAGAGERLIVRWYNNAAGTWEPLPTTVHPATRTVTATVSHFTLIAPFVEAAPVEILAAGMVEETGTPSAGAATPDAEDAGLPASQSAGITAIVVLAVVALAVSMRRRG
ncbi:MAG: hypothetical protein GX882_06910, partial [Methanomicrobiales archaeon]|nr:hypothetical protein [Methanomicrobiales archaeon]